MPPTDDQISRYLADPLSFPPEFKNWVVKYLEQHQPSLLIRELAGTLLPSKIAGYPGSAGKVLAGDGTWPGGMVTVYDTVLPSAAGVIDTGAVLPTTGALMRIECYLRGDTAAATANIFLQLDNVSTASYQYQWLQGAAAAVGAGEGLAQTSIFCGACPANTAGATMFGNCIIDIPHYGNSSNYKAVDIIYGYRTGGTTGTGFTGRTSGWWSSGVAVNRIALLPGAGNFVAGSRVTVSVRSA